MSEPIYFDDAAGSAAWLEAHHDDRDRGLARLLEEDTGEPSMTWSEAVDEALCFGWIDGVLRRIDDERHAQRFTPAQAGRATGARSTWPRSSGCATRAGCTPAGEAAFARRRADRTGVYSFEQATTRELRPSSGRGSRPTRRPWAFFQAQPPCYRRQAIQWVTSAKKPETRARRLAS